MDDQTEGREGGRSEPGKAKGDDEVNLEQATEEGDVDSCIDPPIQKPSSKQALVGSLE